MNGTQSCSGSCKIQVANGSFLDINNIGTYVINTSSKPLILHNNLYTPQITKNLFSSSHFIKDNQFYFEFHSTHCVVCDSLTNQVLLQGSECGDLYKLDFSLFHNNALPKSVHSSVCISNPGI